MKAAKIGTNQAGKRFAIVPQSGFFAVYTECQNYAAHIRGGIAKTWRFCEKGLTIEAAEALFARKVAGKARP